MRIRYENSIDDFVAFAIFHNKHSPAIRRIRGCFMWFFAIGALAVAAGFAYKVASELQERGLGMAAWFVALGSTAPMLIALVFGLIRLPAGFRHRTAQARRMFAEGANKAVLGPREVELIGNELISRSTYVESRMRLEVIVRVVSDGAYTFIYINPTTAIVIPHDAVLEGDPELFVETLKQLMAPENAA